MVFDMDRTASTRQVALALHVTESTVQAYSRDGRIPFDLTPGIVGVVVPEVLHHVEPLGPVRFSVEFYKAAE